MLPIQESEMAQLNHDQQSIVSIKYLAQHLALEFPLKGYFMLTFVCSLLALGILIKWLSVDIISVDNIRNNTRINIRNNNLF